MVWNVSRSDDDYLWFLKLLLENEIEIIWCLNVSIISFLLNVSCKE